MSATLRLAEHLISLPSVTPDDAGCIELIVERLRPLGFACELIESGLYAWVRHPIYCGIILAAFGWALYVQGALSLLWAALLVVFFDIKSRREEAWLAARFPAYADYRRRVRKLIPFIY